LLSPLSIFRRGLTDSIRKLIRRATGWDQNTQSRGVHSSGGSEWDACLWKVRRRWCSGAPLVVRWLMSTCCKQSGWSRASLVSASRWFCKAARAARRDGERVSERGQLECRAACRWQSGVQRCLPLLPSCLYACSCRMAHCESPGCVVRPQGQSRLRKR